VEETALDIISHILTQDLFSLHTSKAKQGVILDWLYSVGLIRKPESEKAKLEKCK
jgi:hypothetical protein